ncbi:MAG: hypothetical protein U1F83_19560 [Verrucomicrobiota bacterium]
MNVIDKTSNATKDSFNLARKGKGVEEWSDRSYNICKGCEHGCLYCYARAQRNRFDPTVRQPGQWERQHLKENSKLGKSICSDKVVMFPSTHDITPHFVNEAVTTVRNLIAGGNHVLIVSKPHLSVVRTLCRQLGAHKTPIMFRFTIGSLDESLCAFWEPGAPAPAERVEALKHAFENGFRTSVSIEPMLGSVDTTIQLVQHLESYVADTIWIGRMQRVPRKLNAHVEGFAAACKLMRSQQTDAEVLRLVRRLQNHGKVRWKDSIKAVMAAARRQNWPGTNPPPGELCTRIIGAKVTSESAQIPKPGGVSRLGEPGGFGRHLGSPLAHKFPVEGHVGNLAESLVCG